MIKFENVRDFDCDHIFDCGQCFRWNRNEDGSYDGVAGDLAANIRYEDGSVYVEGDGDEAFWRRYLDLDTDYGHIKEVLSKNDIIRKALPYGYGIRLLKQDRWETIISFIVSQNNNIPRIKGCIEKICMLAGRNLGDGKHAFPTCEELSRLTEEDLAPARLGYRAKYIAKASREIAELGGEEYLDSIDWENKKVRDFLISLTGIGPKVADCIMLFGFGRYDAFPIDVWVKRLMNRLYGIDESDLKGMKAFAEENFGEYGGFAQQYLFHYIRQIDAE